MTHPTITTSQSCDAAPGLVDVTITIGNDGFTEPVASIDLYGTIGIGSQPPLAPGGQWPKVLHQIVPAGSYTAGAQFHFATLPTRATEISIDVDATVCTTTSSSAPPSVASEPPPPASTETGTPISIDAPATDAPTPTASTEPEPKVEPVVPVALPTTTSSTTIASTAVPVTLPRTGAGDRATIGVTPGILCLCVGLALVALSRRTRRTVRS